MSTTPRVALVTGANRGIGFAIAHGLAALGHQVAVGARSLADGQHAAATIGGSCFPVQIDVTDPASVHAAVDTVLTTAGRIEIIVNNAGGHHDLDVLPSAVSDSDLADAFEVNTIGPHRLVLAALPHLRAQRWGRIVNVTSRSGTFAATWANAPAYGVSKAALNMLTFQMAKELVGTGILMNACCPGWVRTRMGGADAERSVEEGADTPIWLATLPDDGPTGGMFGDRQPIEW